MAKKRTWVWIGIAAAVVFFVFLACICSIAGISYMAAKKQAQIKESSRAAEALSDKADKVLDDLAVMNTVEPSDYSDVKKVLALAEDLPGAESDLEGAKDRFLEASSAGPSGLLKQYVEYKLDSTTYKLEVAKMRKRQKAELQAASRAASLASSAFSDMAKATSYIAQGIKYRNADKYAKAKAVRLRGTSLLSKALDLYAAAKREYPSVEFKGAIAYIGKLQALTRYQASLDTLGSAGRISQYNKIVPKANAAHKVANKMYWSAVTDGTSAAVDRAYNTNVAKLIDDVREKSTGAAAKDASADSIWASLQR